MVNRAFVGGDPARTEADDRDLLGAARLGKRDDVGQGTAPVVVTAGVPTPLRVRPLAAVVGSSMPERGRVCGPGDGGHAEEVPLGVDGRQRLNHDRRDQDQRRGRCHHPRLCAQEQDERPDRQQRHQQQQADRLIDHRRQGKEDADYGVGQQARSGSRRHCSEAGAASRDSGALGSGALDRGSCRRGDASCGRSHRRHAEERGSDQDRVLPYRRENHRRKEAHERAADDSTERHREIEHREPRRTRPIGGKGAVKGESHDSKSEQLQGEQWQRRPQGGEAEWDPQQRGHGGGHDTGETHQSPAAVREGHDEGRQVDAQRPHPQHRGGDEIGGDEVGHGRKEPAGDGSEEEPAEDPERGDGLGRACASALRAGVGGAVGAGGQSESSDRGRHQNQPENSEGDAPHQPLGAESELRLDQDGVGEQRQQRPGVAHDVEPVWIAGGRRRHRRARVGVDRSIRRLRVFSQHGRQPCGEQRRGRAQQEGRQADRNRERAEHLQDRVI